MKIILYQPQIPQNTGNIVRTCSVTGTELILIGPLGFSTSDRWLKRAGLDYWDGVNVTIHDDLDEILAQSEGNFYFLSAKASKSYTEVKYEKDDILIFGSETEGLPKKYFDTWEENCVTIPMLENSRCLNLATSAGIVLYEAQRQQGFDL